MKNVGWLARLRYAFDNTVSRGMAGLVGWLTLVTALLIIGTSVVVFVAGSDPEMDLPEILWDIMFQTLTPNPVDPKAGSLVFIGAMFFASLGSLFLVSIFIGILTNAIDHRIQDLRKGRSMVVERGHTLILGWSPQIFALVSELCVANQNQKRPCIVVLADRDKVEMEDELHARVSNLGRTRLVCRTGSPLDTSDLLIVNPHEARAIVIMSDGDDHDTEIIKAMMALTQHPQRRPEPYHIVAAIREAGNLAVAAMVGRDEVELVLANDLISRITVQTCRQSGLSLVYTELLNFDGDEIYMQAEPQLTGRTFGEALLAYEDSAVIGLHPAGGAPHLNPPMDRVIAAGDLIIAVSADDDSVKLNAPRTAAVEASAIVAAPTRSAAPERTLILGWNETAPGIIRGLDHYVAAGSQTVIVANNDGARQSIDALAESLHSQSVAFRAEETTSREVLDALDVPTFQHVIVLSYAGLGVQPADARTLITLLHLRDIREKSGRDFSIVSEMLDIRNRALAEVTRADDFIVSDQLVSLVMAQIAENKALNDVFTDLFDPAGSEVYLKPATDYVSAGRAINFYTVVEAARRRGEVAIGYRLARDSRKPERGYGIKVNPRKSELVTFEPTDRLIVLGEQ